MPTLDDSVAGLRCGEVLERLSDLVDGEIDGDLRARIVEHVRGCRWCEEFGGRFSAIVRQLREAAEEDELEEDVTGRLQERLARELRK
jgi:anti-sigma factor RsiW